MTNEVQYDKNSTTECGSNESLVLLQITSSRHRSRRQKERKEERAPRKRERERGECGCVRKKRQGHLGRRVLVCPIFFAQLVPGNTVIKATVFSCQNLRKQLA